MSQSIDAASRPVVGRGFRLQWESAQDAHVLLYPEGMIKLNASAGEIMKRCDGEATVADITTDLERAFAATGLYEEIVRFMQIALEKSWLTIR
ncbi:MAG TPA: pyrroloquinoline quinone biosynthesis peptide chaperone PqqD [Steroidobacteraceae bacterium]|nr:pyrroloquinoline quinone biosynthesis peptide chaperone PqqD [Steroidobacteraceae bacterium]